MHWLKWGKTTKIRFFRWFGGFVCSQWNMFCKKGRRYYRKKIWRKTKLDEVLGPLNLSVGLQPINQSTGKYCVILTENRRNTSQTTNKT